MWSCDQNLVTLTFLRKKLSLFFFHINLTRQNNEWPCFKFNTLDMMFGMALNLYSVRQNALTLNTNFENLKTLFLR